MGWAASRCEPTPIRRRSCRARPSRSNSPRRRSRSGTRAAASRVTSARYGRHQQVLDLEHYLDVLEHKPGAFAGSKPLEQWRRAGRWPVSYDQFWNGLMQRHGRQDGTRAMIELLQLGRRLGDARLRRGDRVGAAVGLHRRGGGASSDGQRRARAPAAQPAARGRQPARSVRAAAAQRCTTTTTCWSEPAR